MCASANQEGERRKRPKLGYLRMLFTAICGVLCLLLIAFWVRSYWWVEQLPVPIPGNHVIGLATMPGVFAVAIDPNWGRPPWTTLSNPAGEWLAWGGYNHSRVWGFFGIQATAVIIPFWFAILIATSMVGIPWLHWHFSLRTLLIATTLIAAILGIIAV